MTGRDWAAWLIVLLIVLVVVPTVRWSDSPPQVQIAAAVLADGTDAATATWQWATPRDTPWWTPEPWPTLEVAAANTALVECEQGRATERAQRGQCEEAAPSTIVALWATGTALADEIERLRRTPYGPEPTATARPGWRGWLPMAVRRW